MVVGDPGIFSSAYFRTVFTCAGTGPDKHYYRPEIKLKNGGDRGTSRGSCPYHPHIGVDEGPVTKVWNEVRTEHGFRVGDTGGTEPVADLSAGPQPLEHRVACETDWSGRSAWTSCVTVGDDWHILDSANFRVVFTCEGTGAHKHYYGNIVTISKGQRGTSRGSCPYHPHIGVDEGPVMHAWAEVETLHDTD